MLRAVVVIVELRVKFVWYNYGIVFQIKVCHLKSRIWDIPHIHKWKPSYIDGQGPFVMSRRPIYHKNNPLVLVPFLLKKYQL